MQRVNINYSTSLTTNNYQQGKYVVENFIVPFFSNFNNLTYITTLESNNYIEAVFQINNSNYYLKLGRFNTNNTDNKNYTGLISEAISIKPDTIESNNTYLWKINDGNRFFWYSGYKGSGNFNYIKDANNNLKVLTLVFPAQGNRTISRPIFFTKTISNRDIIIIVENDSVIRTYFLDDQDHNIYYIRHYNFKYESLDKVYKKSCIIYSGGDADAIVDVVDIEFSNIVNSQLYAQQSFAYNDSGYFGNLIKVGTNQDLYRQIVGQWWFKDPFGEEPALNINLEQTELYT